MASETIDPIDWPPPPPIYSEQTGAASAENENGTRNLLHLKQPPCLCATTHCADIE